MELEAQLLKRARNWPPCPARKSQNWAATSDEWDPHGVRILTKRRSADQYHITLAWVEFMQERFTN